jgi:hypothetical protein
VARPKKKTPAKTKRKPAKRKPASGKQPEPAAISIDQAKAEADEAALLSLYKRQKDGPPLKPFEVRELHRLEAEREKENALPAMGDVIPDTTALREYTGWTRRMVSYHIGKNVHANADGSFDRKAVDAYMAKRRGEPIPEDAGTDPATGEKCKTLEVKIKEAELEIKTWRAKREKTFVEQQRGNLFSKNEVLTAWVERVLNVCSGLEALADRLPPLLAGLSPKEMQPIIKNEVRLLREGFAENGKYTPKD